MHYEIGVKTFCSLKFLTFSVLVANPKQIVAFRRKAMFVNVVSEFVKVAGM